MWPGLVAWAILYCSDYVLAVASARLYAAGGRLEYSRPLMLRLSSLELLTFSGLFAVLFLFTGSVFILGGVTTCLSLAVQHWRLARAHTTGKRSNVPLQTATGSADTR
jgi:hypothetical protein